MGSPEREAAGIPWENVLLHPTPAAGNGESKERGRQVVPDPIPSPGVLLGSQVHGQSQADP